MAEDDKTRQSAKAKLRAKQAVSGALQGKSNAEIGEEMGLSRTAVSNILNGEEAAKLIKQMDNDILLIAKKVMKKFDKIADDGTNDEIIRIGLPILRTHGVINEKQEHVHKFPAPTVVRFGGKEIIIGAQKKDREEGNGED